MKCALLVAILATACTSQFSREDDESWVDETGGTGGFDDAVDGSVGGTDCVQVVPIAGADRYETAVLFSQQRFQTATEAVVVSGADNSADFAPGALLAHTLGAPLLLVDKTTLPGATRNELVRLGATHVTLVGGPANVTDNVIGALLEIGVTVERISGGNRFATTAEVAQRVGTLNNTAVIVSSEPADAPVAFLAAAFAASNGAVFLLTEPDLFPLDTGFALINLGITQTIFIGDTVSDQLVAAAPGGIRVSAADLVAMGVVVSELFAPETTDTVVLWPAAVPFSGSAMADGAGPAAAGYPLLHSPPGALSADNRAALNDLNPTTVYALGGAAADIDDACP